MKRAIDFMIIGAAKSGTTTVYEALARHPKIFMPEIKENLYFARDYEAGEDYLSEYYRSVGDQPIVGGNYVHALYFPEVIERIHHYNNKMKLVAILRNPVQRAYSAYWFAVRNGLEELPFEEAIKLDSKNAEGNYIERAEKTYLSHGLYAQQLRGCMQLFPRRQLCVVTTDMLKADPERTLADIFRFLGAAAASYEFVFERRANPAALPRFAWLQRLMLRQDVLYKRIGRRLVPANLRYFINRTLTDRIVNRWNVRRFYYPPMPDSVKSQLVEYYAHPNRKLAALLDLDLSGWTQ